MYCVQNALHQVVCWSCKSAQYALYMLQIWCRVLCMEWIDGVKLTDKPKMDAAGLDIIDFVDIGIECTLRQLLEHGYFHADPHPGKLVPE